MFAAAGMPASSLSSLPSSEVLQLAVRLGDPSSGLPAHSIRWLQDWAETIDPATLKTFTGDQVFELLQLLAAATLDRGRRSSSSSSSGGNAVSRRPSTQLLGLLCWAAADHISTASAQQLYSLVTALAGWQYVPPNGDVLLSAAAARVADKLPMLDQLQLSDVLCGFAQLGFSVGEPLQSKLCSRLLQAAVNAAAADQSSSASGMGYIQAPAGANAAAQQQVESTAAVLASVLTSIRSPPAELVPTLMQQLDSKLQKLPVQLLQQLGNGFIAAGMAVAGSLTAGPAAGRPGSGIAEQWGQQYLAAMRSRVRGMSAQQLAAACSVLQQLGLMADEGIAHDVMEKLQQQLGAPAAEPAQSSSGIRAQDLVPVVFYITASGFRPTGPVMDALEQQVLGMMRSGSSSTEGMEVVLKAVADSSSSSSGLLQAYAASGQQETQLLPQQPQLLPADLAKLLHALNQWGRRPGSAFAAAAYDWSRYRLVECDSVTLGPLLLWLCQVCGKPPQAWVLDWAAVTGQQLQEASAGDLATMAVALAESGGAAAAVSSVWWEGFSTAALQQLQGMSDEEVENLSSSLYRLKHRPSQEWLTAVLTELQGRVPDSSVNTAASRALAWTRQLRAR